MRNVSGINDLRAELSHRHSLDVNDDYGIKESWKRLTEILSENVYDTIGFFESSCTDEEFFWLSEVFEEVAESTKSVALISALHTRLEKVKPEAYNQKQFKSEHITVTSLSFAV